MDRPLPLDKNPAAIRAMFSSIATRYDFLNHLLSLGLDLAWRRRAARAVVRGASAPPAPGRYLDVCSGTADLARAVARARRGAGVIALDFSAPMLRLAARKAGSEILPVQGDALRLPFRNGAFSGATIGFGIRNVSDPRRGLAEMARVVLPGGRCAVLEFGVPGGIWGWIYRRYFTRLLPAVGRRLAGSRWDAYSYLPASVLAFIPPAEFVGLLQITGWREPKVEPLTGGVTLLYSARRCT